MINNYPKNLSFGMNFELLGKSTWFQKTDIEAMKREGLCASVNEDFTPSGGVVGSETVATQAQDCDLLILTNGQVGENYHLMPVLNMGTEWPEVISTIDRAQEQYGNDTSAVILGGRADGTTSRKLKKDISNYLTDKKIPHRIIWGGQQGSELDAKFVAPENTCQLYITDKQGDITTPAALKSRYEEVSLMPGDIIR